MDFRHQHFRIPSIPACTERGLRHSGRRASAFRLRKLRQAKFLGETDCTDDQMGEVHIRQEPSPECGCAFLFTLGHSVSDVTGLGRAHSTSTSLLTPGVSNEQGESGVPAHAYERRIFDAAPAQQNIRRLAGIEGIARIAIEIGLHATYLSHSAQFPCRRAVIVQLGLSLMA